MSLYRLLLGMSLLATLLAVEAAAVAVEPASQPATQPAGAEVAKCDVDRLIHELADSRWQVRNRAVERLAEVGDAARPGLEAARAAAGTVDLRSRIDLALNRISQAKSSGATYVTLHAKSVTPRQCVEALGRASGLKFDVPQGEVGDAPIALDADHQPLWDVLRNFCDQARLEVAGVDATTATVQLQGGDAQWGRRPASVRGPYMIVARRIELSRTLDFTRPADVANAYTLVLLAYAEPKLHPMYWTIRGVEQCVTEAGHGIEPAQRDPWEAGDLNSQSESRLMFTAAAPAGAADRRIARLRLAARFVLNEKSQPLEFPNLLKLKTQTQTVAGWRLSIKEIAKDDNGRYSVGVTVFRDQHDPEQWAERAGLLERSQPRVFDAAGKPLDSGGTSLSQGPDEWSWSQEVLPTNAESKPSRLKWDFPLQIRHADVTFELRDLPLP